MREPLEDIAVSAENQKLLALTESPLWSVFVRLVDEDLRSLDNISSLYIENKNRDELMREVEVRYHTILKIRSYLNEVMVRAEQALTENKEQHSDIIKFHN